MKVEDSDSEVVLTCTRREFFLIQSLAWKPWRLETTAIFERG